MSIQLWRIIRSERLAVTYLAFPLGAALAEDSDGRPSPDGRRTIGWYVIPEEPARV
jgi:hypothetical protein